MKVHKKVLLGLLMMFILTAALFYFVTSNLILTCIYLTICLGSAAFLSLFIFKKYEKKKEKFNECVTFINKFIISLSINGSIIDSYNSCKEILNNKLYLELKVFDDVEARIEYLKKYYNYRLFDIFSGILNEYLDKGGDILAYSSGLLAEARRAQVNVNKIFENSVKHMFSFGVMWSFSFLILLVAKIALNDFYKNFVTNTGFLAIIAFGFLFFIGTFYVYFYSLNLNKFIEEGKYEES